LLVNIRKVLQDFTFPRLYMPKTGLTKAGIRQEFATVASIRIRNFLGPLKQYQEQYKHVPSECIEEAPCYACTQAFMAREHPAYIVPALASTEMRNSNRSGNVRAVPLRECTDLVYKTPVADRHRIGDFSDCATQNADNDTRKAWRLS